MVIAEAIRLLATSVFLSFGVVFDVFNRKELPDFALYTFLLAAVFISLFINGEMFAFSIVQGAFILSVGYLLYKMGVMGLADPIYFAMIALLYPTAPNVAMPIPMVLLVLIYGGVAFGIYSMFHYAHLLYKRGASKPDLKGLLILPAYLGFLYIYGTSPFIDPFMVALITAVTLPAIFVSLYSSRIKELIEEEIDVEDAEEEVLSERERDEVKAVLGKEKVITKKHIEELKKKGVGRIRVYAGMLPFIPFLAVGFITAYLVGLPLILP